MKSLIHIASRYLFFKNKKRAINLLSFITMAAMACGSGALIIILSVFNGFENLSRSLNESFQPDLTVVPIKNKQFYLEDSLLFKLSHHPDVESVSKVLEEKVYLKYENNDVLATIKGVDKSYFSTNEVKDYIIAGDTILETDEYSFALLGAGVAQNLNVNLNNQFEQLAIYAPKQEGTGMGLQDNFELSYLTPGGIFSIYQDYDEKYVIAPLSFVQYIKAADENTFSSLEIKLKNGDGDTKGELRNVLGSDFAVKDKLELNETFYKISRIEKLITFFILTFILIILSFNFIGSMTMHIIEKQRDIKILHYMGLKAKKIFKLYLIYGLFQGILGGLIGLAIGLTICVVQYYFGIVKMPGSGTFVIQDYPVTIYGSDILLIVFVLVVVSVLASIMPARRAKNSILELDKKQVV